MCLKKFVHDIGKNVYHYIGVHSKKNKYLLFRSLPCGNINNCY